MKETRFTSIRIVVTVGLATLLCNAGGTAENVNKTDPANGAWTVTRLADGNPYTCRRAIGGGVYDKVSDTTYVTWPGTKRTAMVAAFDHASGTWSGPVVADPRGSGDIHDYPNLIQAADGTLHVFTCDHNRALRLVSSKKPRSIDAGWEQRRFANGATYPMPVADSSGRIFVFYRETIKGTYRPMRYIVSEDNGRSWSEPRPAIDHANDMRKDNLNEIYVGDISVVGDSLGRGERFLLCWTLAGGRRHDTRHKNVYYCEFDPAACTFNAVDGTDLGEVVSAEETEAHCLVFDSGPLVGSRGGKGQGQDIGYHPGAYLGADGKPFCVFGVLARDTLVEMRWNGKQWQEHGPWPAKLRGADAQRAEDGSVLLYMVRGAHTDPQGKLLVYRRAPGETDWTHLAELAPEGGIFVPIAIENGRPALRVLIPPHKNKKATEPISTAGTKPLPLLGAE